MTETSTSPFLDQEEQEDTVTPALAKLLKKPSTQPRDKAGLRALIEEETVLACDTVRRALIVTNDKGTPVGCAWERLTKARFGLGLDEQQRVFLDVVLSIAGPHHVNLGWLMELDDRHLRILLRAMAEMAGDTTIVIGTRI